jgi:hypothetical protein
MSALGADRTCPTSCAEKFVGKGCDRRYLFFRGVAGGGVGGLPVARATSLHSKGLLTICNPCGTCKRTFKCPIRVAMQNNILAYYRVSTTRQECDLYARPLRFVPFGHFPGQLTIYSSSFSSGTSFSLAATRPRTEMPAVCTVSGSPDTSGCHQARPLPSATRR